MRFDCPNYTKLDEIEFGGTLLGASLIVSMPKLKTHHWAGVTLSLKNMFGTVPAPSMGGLRISSTGAASRTASWTSTRRFSRISPSSMGYRGCRGTVRSWATRGIGRDRDGRQSDCRGRDRHSGYGHVPSENQLHAEDAASRRHERGEDPADRRIHRSMQCDFKVLDDLPTEEGPIVRLTPVEDRRCILRGCCRIQTLV